jgi:hypothetical protein
LAEAKPVAWQQGNKARKTEMKRLKTTLPEPDYAQLKGAM